MMLEFQLAVTAAMARLSFDWVPSEAAPTTSLLVFPVLSSCLIGQMVTCCLCGVTLKIIHSFIAVKTPAVTLFTYIANILTLAPRMASPLSTYLVSTFTADCLTVISSW